MARRFAPLLVGLALIACGSSEPRAAGPQLYLAGDNELWIVDAGNGRVRHVFSSQLGRGEPPHKVLARGRRIVMGTPYGDRAFFIPSARRDRVWVVDLRSDSGTVFSVREVTVDGETTVAATRTPNPRWPLGAVREGLLLEGDREIEVWDPRRDRIVHRLPIAPALMGPAGGDIVTACVDVHCPVLRLIDLDSGTVRIAHAPAGRTFEPWEGAFSPDTGTIALPLRGPGQPATAARELALIDVASGRVGVVPGSTVPPGYTLVAWSASGDDVFITGGDRGGPRVLVGYRLGTRRAHALDVEVGDFYDLAAV